MELVTPRLLREIGGTLYHYARGQIIISAVMAALYAVGFALLGVPLWFLVALVCGFLNLVPWFGTLIAMLIGVAAAILGGLDFWRVMGVVWVFAGVSAIESFVLTPRIHGRRFQIRPLYIFLVVLVGGSLFGFLGMLLAVPALAVAVVVQRYYRKPSGEQQP